MKKILAFALSLFTVAAVAQQVTPNLGLVVQTPPPMANNWSAIINYDLWKLDSGAQAKTIIGASTSPALSCSAAANNGTFWLGTNLSLWMCSNVTGSYSWGKLGGGSSSLISLNGQTGPAEVLQSSGGTVSFSYPDATHINLEAAGGGGSLVPSNATFALTGSSVNDDDNKVIAPTAIPISAISCSGTVCTVTSTGSNSFKAGDWVNMRFSIADFAAGNANLPTTVAIETGGTLFQVLSTGLSSTQFEFNYTLASPTCASACGNAYLANFYLPFATTSQGALAGKGTTVVKLPNPVTIAGLATNFSSMFHSISPAVTGTPGYLIINGLTNDFALSGCSTSTITTEEANLQSIWTQAHTDGWTVVMGTMNAILVDEYGSSCTSFSPLYSMLSTWIYNQGFSATNFASGAYWDRLADVQHVVDDANDPQLVASNGGFGPTGAKLAASTIAEAITTNTSAVHPNRMDFFGFPAANMGGIGGPGGRVFKPYSDSSNSFCFTNAATTNWSMCIGTAGTGGTPATAINGSLGVTNSTNTTTAALSVGNTNTDLNVYSPLMKIYANRASIGGSPHLNNLYSTIGTQAGGNNNGFNFGWAQQVNNSATANSAFINVFGDTLDSLRACTGGEVSIGMATTFNDASPQGCIAGAMLSVGTTGQFKVDSAGNATVHNLTCTGTGCGGGGSLSGMTAGEVPIAATATTVTSSKPLAGAGAAIVTGPTTATSGHCAQFTGAGGQLVDSGAGCGGGNVQAGTADSQILQWNSITSQWTPDNNLAFDGYTFTAINTNGGILPFLCSDTSGSTTAQNCNLLPSGLIGGTFALQSPNCLNYETPQANSGTGLTLSINGGTAHSVRVPSSSGWTTTLSTSPASVPANTPLIACYDGAYFNIGMNGVQAAGGGGGTQQWSCEPGLGDGLNVITSGTYLQTSCKNTTGSTVTITGVQCYADAGTPTMNVSAHTLGALLTGAVTCSSSFAAGTQSANVLLTNGDYLQFTFVAGGTAKQTTWVVTGTY